MPLNRRKFLLTSAFAPALLLVFAALAQACETCEYYPFPGNSQYCAPVLDDQTGAQICTLQYDYWSAKYDCFESGTFCSEINVDGGGGSGDGGGGGGGACGSTGFCASECFSCPGGGGRPPV